MAEKKGKKEKKISCPHRGSNPGPLDYEADALPTAPHRQTANWR